MSVAINGVTVGPLLLSGANRSHGATDAIWLTTRVGESVTDVDGS